MSLGSTMRLLLRLLVVALVVYVLIALLQTLFLEVLLGGRVAPDAPIAIQLAGIAGTVVSGIVGGYLAARLGAQRPWLHGMAVLVPLLLDTAFVIGQRSGGHPLWFNLAGSGVLLGATALGCWLGARAVSRGSADDSSGR